MKGAGKKIFSSTGCLDGQNISDNSFMTKENNIEYTEISNEH